METGTEARAGLLREAATSIAAGRVREATAALDALFSSLDHDDARDLTFQIFGQALARRAGAAAPDVNLYLRDLNLRQIALFNLIATHLPFVRLTGAASNTVLAGLLADTTETTLLDVGIGTGQQEATVLRSLATADRLPEALRIIGIEPSASIIADARRTFATLQDELGIAIEFTAVEAVAEDLSDAEWDALRPGGDVVINAAFAAHHIQSAGRGATAARDHVFGQLRRFEPRAFTLIEPHSDHLEPDFLKRFEHCWEHFGTVLRAIDASDADVTERLAMKMFFAREVDDILANHEDTRAERHERTETWLARLERTGFGLVGALPVPDASFGGATMEEDDGYVRVGFEGTPMVAALCAATSDTTLRELGWVDVAAAAAPVFATDPSRHGPAQLRVRDVMSGDVASIDSTASLADAAAALHRTGASDLVVLDDTGAFVGIVSEGDILRLLLPDGEGFEEDVAQGFELLAISGRACAADGVDRVLIRDPVVLRPDDDLLAVATTMIGEGIRRLPVVEDGDPVGTVSRADLAAALLVR